ncbi:MAG: hypothetical protein PUC29_08575 [Clostridia bacterium]|nr:hypothetical protein [Clostridia bacterium]
MNGEKTLEELKKENEELRELLSQVCRAYEILDNVVKSCPGNLSKNGADATVDSKSDVKELLKKYSRI